MKHIRATIFAVPLLLPAGLAAADNLPDVQLGLWQWTTEAHMTEAMLPADEMAKVPESMRAQVVAAMHQASKPHTYRGCLTEAKLRQGFSVQNRHDSNCAYENLSSGPGQLQLRAVCHMNSGDAISHVTLNVVDRQTFDGTVEANPPGATGTPQFVAHIAGKFVSADCGDVKP